MTRFQLSCWDLDYLLSILTDDNTVTCSPQRPLPAHRALGTTHQNYASTGRQKQLSCTPQHQAVGLEQGCPFSPAAVTSLGAHEPHYDFGLWRNFTGHFYELRGFQPGLASEAFRKLSKNTDLWAPPSPPKPVLFKSFPSDCGGQSQVWGPIIIPHSDFSDEVSNLPKLKGWFIQQIFILQLLCSRYIDLIA